MEEECLQCPICHLRLEPHHLERHVNSHLDEADCAKDRALACQLASTSHSSLQDIECWKDSLVTCTECCKKVSMEYWASHCLMHELQADDYSKSCQRNSRETEDRYMDRIHFSKKQKGGPCIFDKGLSGSTTEVTDGMDKQVFLSTQRKGVFRPVAEGINNLLRNCLELENQKVSCTAISGHIDHFESCVSEDSGWGCGWRNIQMMSSHLLTQNWGAKEALFGGVGFIPDIPSLQHWLELAWACGFDRAGAEFYHDKIYGSKEWIGAGECAALFRSFGLRARVVDFSSAGDKMKKGGQSSIERWLHGHSSKRIQRQNPEGHKALENSAIHHDVECDMCGAYPIRGMRFKSRKRIDYDVCSACLHSSEENPDEYEKIETFPRINVGFKGKEVARDEDVNHESLVNWVWDYFTGGTKDSSVRACMDRLHGQVVTSCCTPLYFQHQGHSRTIVGMQRQRKNSGAKEEVFLLVLDPSIVHPKDVLDPSRPRPIMILADCPSISHISVLTSAASLQPFFSRSGKIVNCVVHISPASVTNCSEYQHWMTNFKEAHHLMAQKQLKELGDPILKSRARIQSKLNFICPEVFPITSFLQKGLRSLQTK